MLYYMIDYVCAILVRILNLIFHFLPSRFTLWLGRQLGIIVYHLNPSRRIIGYANLRAAFSGEKTPQELKKMIKKVYRSMTETFCEILSLTKVNEKYIDKYVDFVGTRNMLKVADYPRGVIFLTAHFGNWELSGMASAAKGLPPVVLAREQRMKRLNELINRLRESKGLQVVRKGTTTKYIVKALHEGRMIGMVGDQDAGKAGVFVDFFGRLVSTAPGTARIAAKTGAYILPAFMVRINGPYHRLTLEEPVKIPKGEDIKPYLASYNKLLEKYVRAHPEQWLWLHRRWKSSPLKKVIILSDGKAGHLNQAKALYKEFKRYRKIQDRYSSGDTQAEIIEIKFKNRFTKALLSLMSLFSDKNCQGCMRCLKFSLTKESYENLMKKYCDTVISCGSGVAGVNRLFAIENNAKNAVVMKPSILRLKQFDMAVLPQHDRPNGKEGSIIVTDTVPNLMDEEYLSESAKKISKVAKLEKPKRIGILLGGDNSDFTLTEDITKKLLDNITKAASILDADLLFTTSRRTPKEAERIVSEKLSGEKRCRLLVIANKKNLPHAVGGILGLADIVVVSGESASMVSEAIYSGKPVIVFGLKKKKKNSKFEKMLYRLKEKEYIITADVGELSEAIERTSHTAGPKKLPEDRYNVYKYMWRLL